MTRQEAEREIRQTDRTCKGNWLLSAGDRKELSRRYYIMADASDFQAATNFKRAIERVLNLPEEEVPEGDWTEMFRRVCGMIFGCKNNCGYDVNNVICQYPFDGQEREVACPKCKTNITFHVLYELSD